MEKNLTNLTSIIDKFDLTPKEVEYLRLKMLSFTNADIAKSMEVSEMTIYRIGAKKHIKQALQEIMTIAMSDSVIGLGTVMQNAIKLYNDVITSDSVPVEYRISASNAVVSAYFKMSASERESRVLDLFMEQNQPNAVESVPLDFVK